MKVASLTIHALATLSVWSCASAQQSPEAQKPNWPKGPCVFAETDPLPAAEKCKELAEAGDADAMYQFSSMLLFFAPGSPGSRRAAAADVEKWKTVGSWLEGPRWVTRAAEKGSQEAIREKCEVGKDVLAPADLRNGAKKWCDLLAKPTDEVPAAGPVQR